MAVMASSVALWVKLWIRCMAGADGRESGMISSAIAEDWAIPNNNAATPAEAQNFWKKECFVFAIAN